MKPSQADMLMSKIFDATRDPRSDAYKEGVRAAIRKHFEGVSIVSQLTYAPGTAEHDAFFAGTDEGYHRVRAAQQSGRGPVRG